MGSKAQRQNQHIKHLERKIRQFKAKGQNTEKLEKVENSREVYFGPNIGSTNARVITRSYLSEVAEEGPIIIEEYEGTVVVPPDCTVRVDKQGNVIIKLPEI